MNKPRIGGYEFNAECVNVESSFSIIRNALNQIIDTNPGPQTLSMLVAKMAVQVSNGTDAINKIKAIGKEAKKERDRTSS
jgi:hypothetical protein